MIVWSSILLLVYSIVYFLIAVIYAVFLIVKCAIWIRRKRTSSSSSSDTSLETTNLLQFHDSDSHIEQQQQQEEEQQQEQILSNKSYLVRLYSLFKKIHSIFHYLYQVVFYPLIFQGTLLSFCFYNAILSAGILFYVDSTTPSVHLVPLKPLYYMAFPLQIIFMSLVAPFVIVPLFELIWQYAILGPKFTSTRTVLISRASFMCFLWIFRFVIFVCAVASVVIGLYGIFVEGFVLTEQLNTEEGYFIYILAPSTNTTTNLFRIVPMMWTGGITFIFVAATILFLICYSVIYSIYRIILRRRRIENVKKAKLAHLTALYQDTFGDVEDDVEDDSADYYTSPTKRRQQDANSRFENRKKAVKDARRSKTIFVSAKRQVESWEDDHGRTFSGILLCFVVCLCIALGLAIGAVMTAASNGSVLVSNGGTLLYICSLLIATLLSPKFQICL